ncbi:MAG: acetate--CoA ligase family protein, partial [Pseudomonadota bacterium]
LIPSSEHDVSVALARLKIAALLDGYRGAPAVDRAALLEAIMNLQAYVVAVHPEEVEINPLICTEVGVWVVDALIVREDADV